VPRLASPSPRAATPDVNQVPDPTQAFTRVQEGDSTTVTIHEHAGHHSQLATPASYAWAAQATGVVYLDFSKVLRVNSVMVAWLFNIVQTNRQAQLVVRHANPGVVIQFRQVFLDRFLTIEEAADPADPADPAGQADPAEPAG
jgi:anti-anti-sigma regulatory factor